MPATQKGGSCKGMHMRTGNVAGADARMFGLLWGPTLAAVSVVLDHAEDGATAAQALRGLLLAARIGAAHQVDEVRRSYAQFCTRRKSTVPDCPNMCIIVTAHLTTFDCPGLAYSTPCQCWVASGNYPDKQENW